MSSVKGSLVAEVWNHNALFATWRLCALEGDYDYETLVDPKLRETLNPKPFTVNPLP